MTDSERPQDVNSEGQANERPPKRGMDRRKFLTAGAFGAAGLATWRVHHTLSQCKDLPFSPLPLPPTESGNNAVSFTVKGKPYRLSVVETEQNKELAERAFIARKTIFFDQQGWAASPDIKLGHGMETDDMDGPHTVHILLEDSNDRIVGVARLTSCRYPHLTNKFAKDFGFGNDAYSKDKTWDLSRVGIYEGEPGIELEALLLAAAMQYVKNKGGTELVACTSFPAKSSLSHQLGMQGIDQLGGGEHEFGNGGGTAIAIKFPASDYNITKCMVHAGMHPKQQDHSVLDKRHQAVPGRN